MNCNISQTDINKKILKLESATKQIEQVDLKIVHYFADGLYAREMHQPAGVLVVGKIHKKEHFCVISKGKVTVASEEKSETISAPFTYVSKPGAKRAIYAHEDSIWTTFHPATSKNLEELENDLIAESFDQLLEQESKGELICHG